MDSGKEREETIKGIPLSSHSFNIFIKDDLIIKEINEKYSLV